MANEKMTLKKLAEKLGVSTSTVSKALSDSPEISELTKKKVKEVAEILNYQPNILARQLKSGHTNTIGVIVPSIQNNFFVQVLDGIEKVLKDAGYNLIISTSQESLEKEASVINTLSNGIVDAFIISVCEEAQTTNNYSHLEAVKDSKPIVMFDRTVPKMKVDMVKVDDYEAVYETTKLLQQSKKHIALVSTLGNLTVGKQRKKGFIDAQDKLGNTIADLTILESNPQSISKDLTSLFHKHDFDAVITLDEESSLAVFTEAKKRNKSIPDDIALVGYINEKLAQHLSPAFSSINQHGYRIGETSAALLLERLKSSEHSHKDETITSTIERRDTF